MDRKLNGVPHGGDHATNHGHGQPSRSDLDADGGLTCRWCADDSLPAGAVAVAATTTTS
jgi:hypothetical protein